MPSSTHIVLLTAPAAVIAKRRVGRAARRPCARSRRRPGRSGSSCCVYLQVRHQVSAGRRGTDQRIERELAGLRCREHARRLITSASQLGEREEVDGKRMRRRAHQLGFGGHCFTKTRRYAPTFKPRREARALGAAGRSARAGEAAAESDHNVIRVSAWDYAGRGYPRSGDALLAGSTLARTREQGALARLERGTKARE